jgi:hypothetical protein
VPFCPETSDLRQDLGNEEHATGKQADLTFGAKVPIGEILGTNVQFVGYTQNTCPIGSLSVVAEWRRNASVVSDSLGVVG